MLCANITVRFLLLIDVEVVARDDGGLGETAFVEDLPRFDGEVREVAGVEAHARELIGRALPGRQNVVVTRQEDFEAPGCKVVNSLVDAIGVASMADGNDEIFVIGGGELYREVLPSADRVYLTRVHASVEGDTTFPELDPKLWKEIARHEHPADAENPQAMTFLVYEKK
jgi:dihydrofolate reductase